MPTLPSRPPEMNDFYLSFVESGKRQAAERGLGSKLIKLLEARIGW